MPIDAKHEDLQSLRIDRTQRGAGDTGGEPPLWARRYIVIGIALVALLSLSALAYRLLSATVPEVEVVRATAESSDVGGTVLSATGYIVAHHTINVNSKVTGRLAWIGVEKGDKVKEGQVLVRLEDQEFRAGHEQAKGAAANARAYLRSCRTDRARKRSSRRNTISTKPRLRSPTISGFWIARRSWLAEGFFPGRRWTTPPQNSTPTSRG